MGTKNKALSKSEEEKRNKKAFLEEFGAFGVGLSDLGGKKWKTHPKALDAIHQKLVSDHSIKNHEAHRQLIERIARYWTGQNLVSLDKESWSIPKDAPGWKETKREIKRLLSDSGKIAARMDRLLENQTFIAAIELVNIDDNFQKSYSGLLEYREFLIQAMSIEGQKGNRFNPIWFKVFAELCRDFWLEHEESQKESIKGQYKNDSIRDPSSRFTAWAREILVHVGGLPLQASGTELRRI